MKRIFTILAALCAIAVSFARPASACTGPAGYRDFPLWTLNDAAANLVFGNVKITSGATTIETVAACNTLNNTLETFRNGFNPEFYTSLPQNTRLCLHGGNDRVRVLRQNETYQCGAYKFETLQYGGKKLMIVGQAGTDTLMGGDGADVLNIGFGDTAGSADRAAGGPGNDELRLSSVSTSRAWGGRGNDTYIAGSGPVFNRAEDIDGNSDVYTGTAASVDKYCDSDISGDLPMATVSCGNTSGDKSNVLGSVQCNAHTWICEAMGATIPWPES